MATTGISTTDRKPIPTVCVVIPVFNRLDLLRRAAQSALHQDYPITELIIVDDGSTEPVTKERLGVADDRVKIVRLPVNRGAAAARNLAVEQASSDILAFLDSDDYWFPDKLGSQIDLLHQYSPAQHVAVVCGWQTRQRQNSAIELSRVPIPSGRLVDFASGCWFAGGSTLIIYRQTFLDVGLFAPELRRLEDFEWFLRFAIAGGRVVVAPVIGCYVTRGRNAKLSEVEAAARYILARLNSIPHPSVTPEVRRHLLAWLDVERAIAARDQKQFVAMLIYLGCSLWQVPRSRIMLRRWWAYGPARFNPS